SPDGRRLLSGSRDRHLRLWSVGTGEPLVAFPEAADWVSAAQVSPIGDRALTILGKEKLALWDTAKGTLVNVTEDGMPRQVGAIFDAEGREVTGIGEDGARRVWGAQSGALLRTSPGAPDKLIGALISPDRSMFAAWKWDEVELRSMGEGAPLTKLAGPSTR